MLPSRPHSHITILTSWWVFGRVGGGGYGLIFGQMGSHGQSHVGGGLPRPWDKATDRPQMKGGRREEAGEI